MALIREKPPLRLSHDIETPSGKHYRWGEDEPKAQNIPSNVRFSDTMPGGFETGEAVLPRKSEIAYSDLERLSTWTMYGAGGEVAWEGRLERAPRTSGEQMAVSPSAVGWQVHLEDDKSARAIYVDRDMSHWGELTLSRRASLAGSGLSQGKIPVIVADGGISWEVPTEALTITEITELMYQSPAGLGIAAIGYQGVRTGSWTNFEAATLYTSGTDDMASTGSTSLTLDDTIRHAVTPAGGVRFGMLRAFVTSAHTPAAGVQQRYSKLAVYGAHGVATFAVSGETDGVNASGVVAHAVRAWAPLLVVNTDSIQPSSFIIPHLVFLEPTTAAEVIRQATRFGLQDWAVWDNREFVWHERGVRGRSWRARIGPSQLEETGPAVDRLWESIMVQYQDVDGSIRMVGPPGSLADTESSDLKDDDPENPANKLGVTKRDLLQMGVTTAAGATEIGRQFLLRAKELDRSGRASLVGHVEDDRGVLHPYWKVRAGDTISFVDAADASARRIVKTDKSHGERSCSVELDAPPDALQALLERLGVVLVRFGL